VAHWPHIHVLPFIIVAFLASDNLVLVHLSEAFLLVALRVREDSVGHAIVVGAHLLGQIVTVLVLAIALNALHVEIAPIEAIT
jgi:hypothetical protein